MAKVRDECAKKDGRTRTSLRDTLRRHVLHWSAIEVGAGGGNGGRALGVLRGERLEDAQRAARKRQRDAGEIGHPDPIFLLSDVADRFLAIGRQALAPKFARAGVMQAPG